MGNKILVVSGSFYQKAITGLGEIVVDVEQFMQNPEQFKLVLFTGGADVSPSLYGDTSPKGMCTINPPRDKQEQEIFKVARKYNIKMTGICRGSQFINVMCGGRMMHHVSKHALGNGTHLMYSDAIKEPIRINSLHHQMSILTDEARLIGWANKESDVYFGHNDTREEWDLPETEVFVYPKYNVCGAQYHPETMPVESKGYQFFHSMIQDFLSFNMDEFLTIYTNIENVSHAQQSS